ncbi:hypothetical protein G7Y89_g13894 [Cudoniella acicularis]|uniref:Uncharacterized protein n=1 Tax=Cudoniella acicularis TaxID=354080 RepID=A0A8H4R8X5_9HELO|nr:hypothetical protein G7Y89_g13894 [Cudoniella acicularis]
MALVSWSSIDSRLASLQRQSTLLENELTEIRTSYHDLRRQHENECAEALMEALSNLVKVVKYVNRVDRALIFWVERGGVLKTALRYIGIDKRTGTIVQKKTAIIKYKVSEVEGSFEKSHQAFKNGLTAVQNLDITLTRYSHTSVGRAQSEVCAFSAELEGTIKRVDIEIRTLKAKSAGVESEAAGIPGRISDVNSQCRAAEEAREDSTNRSIAGFMIGGAALAASIFFPPVALVAAPAALASTGWAVGNAVNSIGFDSQVDNLRERERELDRNLSNLRSQIDELDNQNYRLSRTRNNLDQANQDTERLENKCREFRTESHKIRGELLSARQVLSGMVLKTEAIITALADGREYSRTRRELAQRLNGVIQGLSDIGNRQIINYNSKENRLLTNGMSTLQKRTNRVLMIMDRAS